MQDKIRATLRGALDKTANDPTRHDRLRKEMMAEVEKVKTKLVKFDGQKTGYDVSIVDQEFLHNAGESMLVAKEETATRYFFFKDDRLYKMFIAFDKEILQGKSFREFGQLMQARFGKAKEVTVEEKTKAGVKVKLDHFVWSPTRAATSCGWSTAPSSTTSTVWSSTTARSTSEQEAARQARADRPRAGQPGRGGHHPAVERPRPQRQRRRPHHRQGGPEAG